MFLFGTTLMIALHTKIITVLYAVSFVKLSELFDLEFFNYSIKAY